MMHGMKAEELVDKVLTDGGFTIRFNEFTHSLIIQRPGAVEPHIMQDIDRAAIAALFHNAGLKLPTPIATACVDLVAHMPKNRFHPVRNYLAGLQWDGVPRVGKWLHTYLLADDTELNSELGKLVLVAAVRRVRQPGCKFDELLTLVAPEGVGKSMAVKALVPNKDWFSDSLPLGDEPKETIEKTTGVWIVEAAELIGNTRASVAEIKASLSRQVDGPVRMAYAKEPVTRARQYVPIATTNESAFLKSMNGDRRFWPVRVRYGHVTKLESDRDQLWAETAELEKTGMSIRLDEKYWKAMQQFQSDFSTEDPLEDKLTPASLGLKVTAAEIYAKLDIPLVNRTQAVANRISAIMQKNGYKRTRLRVDGDRQTVYEFLTIYDSETFDHNPLHAEEDNIPDDAYTEADLHNAKLEEEFIDAEVEDYV